VDMPAGWEGAVRLTTEKQKGPASCQGAVYNIPEMFQLNAGLQ